MGLRARAKDGARRGVVIFGALAAGNRDEGGGAVRAEAGYACVVRSGEGVGRSACGAGTTFGFAETSVLACDDETFVADKCCVL